MADPRVVIDYQRRIDEIVADLRAEFDLKP
jgi:hypothetical protein